MTAIIAPMILLPLLLLGQVIPPPFGQFALLLVVGRAYGTDQRDVPVPEPRLQSAPAEDCNCGVPASPRGPR
ncbi:hypothetical protein [Roseomonas sp. CECT 9278]|uniref:hypothetical protein n=1 Tax=Roseomonas sp. CECT 9278 TaxID=2845823 RepID=UPI001E6548F1|nr:hypothetical protein [Roseomonas sp. CECT 9278]CAH0135188.1 hypothetical protein ROS9278_00336 [Roseomonas sp. CECT 9278]